MKLGIAFPTNEIGNDPAQIRDFAQGAEDLGYDYMFLTDHVLQIQPDDHPGAFAPYTLDDPFHEPLVTIGFLAAVTEKIQLTTGILITPQRQTVLMAKQAAQADLLSGGRLRLGIGIGWQEIEFTALGEDFYNRGIRSEEQVELMRALWMNKTAEFKGNWHHLPKSGFNPNSVQKPIPIWFG
ncbi:MAG: TIGR03619 family F420-dependent LLM class oxidoreductase, partial [Alphaproteobacteria bacterium]|nr:TIGR03619 family F420-dependent LLM class oxidoreductase [Alphaproteobacteria bacterium]